jgi:hypothetical protein
MIGVKATLLALNPGITPVLVPAVVLSAGLYHILYRAFASRGKSFIRVDRAYRWFDNIELIKIDLIRKLFVRNMD